MKIETWRPISQSLNSGWWLWLLQGDGLGVTVQDGDTGDLDSVPDSATYVLCDL